MNLFSIKNKVILITGATGYLASQMVYDLNKLGAVIIVLSREKEKALSVCKKNKIDTQNAYEIDLNSKDSIFEVFSKVYDTFGSIDILINNACSSINKSFYDYSNDDWNKSFEGTVNIIDRTIQVALKFMKKNNSSRIINISSMYGMVSPNPDVYLLESEINPLSYGVGKAALIQYTKYAAMKLAKDNITVNTISYGPFPNINNIKDKVFLENLAQKTFLKRIGKPNEATSSIYFLSLDESSYITGQNIVVDGGWTSW